MYKKRCKLYKAAFEIAKQRTENHQWDNATQCEREREREREIKSIPKRNIGNTCSERM